MRAECKWIALLEYVLGRQRITISGRDRVVSESPAPPLPCRMRMVVGCATGVSASFVATLITEIYFHVRINSRQASATSTTHETRHRV